MDQHADGAKRLPGRPYDSTLGPVILGAVLDVLADEGYAGLTTAAVAKRAGVSTATLYRRWSSKRELLIAAAEQIAATEPEIPDTGSLEGDLRALLQAKQRLLSGRVGQTLLVLAGESVHDADLAQTLRASVLEPTRQHMQTIFARAPERKEPVSPVSASSAANMVVGVIFANAAFDATPHSSASAQLALTEADAEALVHVLASPPLR